MAQITKYLYKKDYKVLLPPPHTHTTTYQLNFIKNHLYGNYKLLFLFTSLSRFIHSIDNPKSKSKSIFKVCPKSFIGLLKMG